LLDGRLGPRRRLRPLISRLIRPGPAAFMQILKQIPGDGVAPPSESVGYYTVMARRPPMLKRQMRRSAYAAFWGAYLLLCGSLVFAGTMLKITGFASPPGDLQVVQAPPAVETPVARIQFMPDRNNLCRALVFHNDSGRYQEGGTGECTIPRDMMTVWNVSSRAEAFAQAFRSSWKGDALASSLH